MTRPTLTLAAILGLALAPAALAQTTTGDTATQTPATTEAPATPETPPAATEATPAPDDLSLGTPADDGIGSTYVVTTHGDWEERCIRTEDGSDPCQLYQLLKDEQGNPVVEISIFGLPEGGPAVTGATIIVPLETLLTANMTLQVDGGAAKKYPFTWCAPVGCIARVGFTAEELAALKKGVKATITIVPVVAPDQKVNVTASLKGFTAGYQAVTTPRAPAPAEGGN
jgi:invasion protein IalB